MPYIGNDLKNMDPTVEDEPYSLNFASDRNNPLDTIVSVVWTLTPTVGTDVDASTRFGSPTFTAQSATVIITGLLSGVRYRLQAVTTWTSGEVLSLYSFINCIPLLP